MQFPKKTWYDLDASHIAFLNNLNEEKLMHKQHRHKFTQQKLIFTISLFTLGNVNLGNLNTLGTFNLQFLLYIVPYVALIYDMYIFSEDFKIKRIGSYIRYAYNCHKRLEELPEFTHPHWENYLSTLGERREKVAIFANAGLTIISFLFSAILLHQDPFDNSTFYLAWLILTIFLKNKRPRTIIIRNIVKINQAK